jgi:hypothetical protein
MSEPTNAFPHGLPMHNQDYADWLERLVIGFPSQETANELTRMTGQDFIRIFGLALGILKKDYYPPIKGVD